MSIAKSLSKHLGGTWKYDGLASWWCDDDKRHVSRCSAGVDDWDNELGPAQYWLYGIEVPERAEKYMGVELPRPQGDGVFSTQTYKQNCRCDPNGNEVIATMPP
jgi:hypothetical protein